MTVLSAQTIRERCQGEHPLIQPFAERAVSNGRTYGLSFHGYDIRLAKSMWLWPFWGRLNSSMEKFDMPNDLCAEVKDKSTNARMFVLVQNTVIEAGWRGYLTLELTRFRPWPVFLKAGTPIAQILFKQLDQPTETGYTGKYQDQEEGAQKARLTNER